MKRSPPAALVLVDLAARLAVPGSLLALSAGRRDAALGAGIAVSALAVLRGLLAGHAFERALVTTWGAVIQATRRTSVGALHTRDRTHGAVALFEAVQRVAAVRAQVVPRLVADAVGLAGVAVAVWLLLGPTWLALGLAVTVAVGALVAAGQRRLGRHEQRAFALMPEVGHDFEMLLEAPAELRGQGLEASFSAALQARVERMARARRAGDTWRSLIALLPLGIAIVAVVIPLDAAAASEDVLSIGVLGCAGLVMGIGLVRAIEGYTSSRPQRRLLARYCGGASAQPTPRHGDRDWGEVLEADELTIVHHSAATDDEEPSEHATPASLSFTWHGGGLALTGANGSGKTSVALAILGLVPLARGRLTIGGQPIGEVLGSLREHVVFLPQHPYVCAVRSVGWHLRVIAGEVSETRLQHALERVGLWATLARRSHTPLAILAGALSGGEQRRMLLARMFLRDEASDRTPLIILDEPETGLDSHGREELRDIMEQLAEEARVLLIAHDPAMIPDNFEVVRLDEPQPISARKRRLG